MQFPNDPIPSEAKSDATPIYRGETNPDFFLVATEPSGPNTAPVQCARRQLPATAIQVEPETLLRYKFSVIYYPDSGVWTLKNDFTGHSEQIRTCDGTKIEQFLKTQMPGVDRPNNVPHPELTTHHALKQFDIRLVDRQGNAIIGALPPGCPALQRVCLRLSGGTLEGAFQIRLMVRMMNAQAEGRWESRYNKMKATEGQISIPISGSIFKTKGTYVLSVEANRAGVQDAMPAYSGSLVVVVQ
ncbi:MAG: hypothetical protein ACOYNO_10060 [Saprospiraceae bacterium]